jgi:hypothetical protein
VAVVFGGFDAVDLFEALGELALAAFVGGVVEDAIFEGVGEALHVGDFALFVVGVAVALAVVELLH